MSFARLLVPALAAAALVYGQAKPVRFDFRVRNDLFAGFAGDQAALKRGIETCEQVLENDPNHAEALVWLGSANVFLAGQEFQKGNPQAGSALSQKGITQMDRAVELESRNIGVRIPRGATLMSMAGNLPDSPFRQGVLERARSDYQLAFDLQQDRLDKLGVHPLGELLQGLGNLHSLLGKTEEAERYYKMIEARLQDTIYAKRAALWMETRKPLPAAQTACVGCHTGR